MPPPTTYHHQNWPTSSKPTSINQPTLVTQLTPTPPPVPTPLTSIKPSVVHQPTMTKTTTMTMKPKTITKKLNVNHSPTVSLTHEPTNPTITMEHCKEFIASEMAIFWARLKKQLNIHMRSAANSNNVNHLTTTRPPTVPSPMAISSEGFIAGEMAILQAKLKKLFALDMADFHATKYTSTAVTSNINQLKRLQISHPL